MKNFTTYFFTPHRHIEHIENRSILLCYMCKIYAYVVKKNLNLSFKIIPMKNIFLRLAFAASIISILGACASATKQFSKRLEGNWEIIQYKTEIQQLQRTAFPPYRSITFMKKGRGRVSANNEYSAEKGGQGFDFDWSCTENTVTMRGFDTDFARSWIVVENKKSSQVWKSTDGANGVQTLELRK